MSNAPSLRRSLTLTLECLALTTGGLGLLMAPRGVQADDRTPAPVPAAANGADLFAQNCAACHGAKGDGDGPAAPGLEPKPRKLSSKAVMSAISDGQILKIIKTGGLANGKSPLMPAFGQLDDGQIKALLAHIRSLCGCSFKP